MVSECFRALQFNFIVPSTIPMKITLMLRKMLAHRQFLLSQIYFLLSLFHTGLRFWKVLRPFSLTIEERPCSWIAVITLIISPENKLCYNPRHDHLASSLTLS